MKTIDIEFSKLCNEIDYWKERAEYFEALYKEELAQEAIRSKERLLDAQKGVVNALMFAMSASDDKNGNLVISKENRIKLAENYK